MTVLEAIDKSRLYLESKGVDAARLESEWMLGHVLQLPRLQLYLNFDRRLSDAELTRLREMIKRRGSREPLQHILGTAVFCGIEIAVNKNVLIPRPETELLAEAAWRYLNELQRPATFLDFGTGSGCLAVAICQNAPNTRCVAIDKSVAALQVAAQNAGNVTGIELMQSDGFSALTGRTFDLIVANPPYIPSSEIASLQPEVRDHDPYAALDGGVDGLDFYRNLASQSVEYITQGGTLMLEFGDDQATPVSRILLDHGWSTPEVRNDLSNRPRFVFSTRPPHGIH